MENVLQQFQNVILLYHEQDNSTDSLAMPQILFCFLVLIRENESFFRKYCPMIIDIMHSFMKWTIDTPNEFSSMIYVCSFAFSVLFMFGFFNIDTNAFYDLSIRSSSICLFYAVIINKVS